MDGRIEPQAMNLGTGKGYSVREVIETARRVTVKNFSVVEAARRAGDPAVLVAEANRAKKALGWNPTASDLENIVRTAWNWLLLNRRRGL
jgi:UDP-glucose 4-epimerase